MRECDILVTVHMSASVKNIHMMVNVSASVKTVRVSVMSVSASVSMIVDNIVTMSDSCDVRLPSLSCQQRAN